MDNQNRAAIQNVIVALLIWLNLSSPLFRRRKSIVVAIVVISILRELI